MTYRQALALLQQVQGENFKLSLANVQRLSDGFPGNLRLLRFLQVAGTNGKGSTCHFLAAILQQAGFRVGLFTSPHLQDVRERIRVNGRMISQIDFARAIEFVSLLSSERLRQKEIANPPTFFEYLFLAALHHFLRRQVDWVVLEVGLGGRLDATSTVRPEVTVITNISFDHQDILGHTLKQIAAEKAGIIKPGVPLVCGCLPDSPPAAVIRRIAAKRGAEYLDAFGLEHSLECEEVGGHYRCRYRSGLADYGFQVHLAGRHQAANAALAIKTVEVLRRQNWTIPLRAIGAGIRRMRIAGRIERFAGTSVPPLILDGGHNPEGVRMLTRYLSEKKIRDATLIFGVLQDKDYRQMAALLKPFASRVLLAEPASDRALPAENLLPCFRGVNARVEKDLARALRLAKKYRAVIIVSGSLYLAGAMRKVIQEQGLWKSHDSKR